MKRILARTITAILLITTALQAERTVTPTPVSGHPNHHNRKLFPSLFRRSSQPFKIAVDYEGLKNISALFERGKPKKFQNTSTRRRPLT